MRPALAALPLILTLSLACGGGGEVQPAPASPASPAKASAASAQAPARPAPKPPADDPTLAPLSGQYLVILASKLDSAESEAALRALPSPQPGARLIPSSRFKNLMPCYTVAIAGGFADKKEALALGKSLKAAGVDNYVKNAGSLVPPSAAVEGYCTARRSPPPAGEIQLVLSGGGRSWVPSADPIPAGLPAPVALGQDYDAWEQPAGPASGAWNVAPVDGPARACNATQRSVITLGTPHFGIKENGPPDAPVCGSPRAALQLDCALTGPAVASQSATPIPWPGSPAPGLDAAAAAALASRWGGPGKREIQVTRHAPASGEGQPVLLVAGTESDDAGVCGGYSTTHFALFLPEGDGLGRQIGAWSGADFADQVWLIDADGDRIPEILIDTFPENLSLRRADGTVIAEQSIDYCDCPC